MRKGCKQEIMILEELLERNLTKMEHDLFEFAYDKGYSNAIKEVKK